MTHMPKVATFERPAVVPWPPPDYSLFAATRTAATAARPAFEPKLTRARLRRLGDPGSFLWNGLGPGVHARVVSRDGIKQ